MASLYRLVKMVHVPPRNPESFDFGWVDPKTGAYYQTDRTNKAVDLFEAPAGDFTAAIGGFVGFNPEKREDSGPNGIEGIADMGRVWAGDGDSTVKVIDCKRKEAIATVNTGGRHRVDLLACDPKKKIVLVINDKDAPPFLTFIGAKDSKVIGKLELPDVTFGPESPVWNPRDGMFYIAATMTKQKPGGEVYVVDPVSMKLVRSMDAAGCVPVGCALGPMDHLFLAGGGTGVVAKDPLKSVVMDARDGRIVSTLPQVSGTDQAYYDPVRERFYAAASAMTEDGTKNGKPTPFLSVVDARTGSFIENVPTSPGSHSVAVNPKNGYVFVPSRGNGIAVFVGHTPR